MVSGSAVEGEVKSRWGKRLIENLRPLTSLRFMAAMMIVALHAKLYFPGYWQEWMD